MTLGEKIQLGRKKTNLSKEDFASILNISLEVVDAIESDRYVPDTKTMVQISNILNLSLDYLLKDVKNEEPVVNVTEKGSKDLSKKKIKKSKLTTIRCLLVAEVIISTVICVFWGLALSLQYGWIAGIVRLFVSLPIAIHSVNKIKKSKHKTDFLAESIIVLLFTGLISGIFMLCIKDDDYTYLENN